MVFHKIIPACEYRRVKSICLPSPNFVRQLTSRRSQLYRYFLYLQYGVVGYACFHHFAGYKIKVSPSFSVQFSPRYSPWSRWSAPSSKGQWALFTLLRGFSIGTAYWLLIYQSLGLLANEFTFPTLPGVSRCDTYEPRYTAASSRQTTRFAHDRASSGPGRTPHTLITLISPFTMAKSTKKTKYYTHEEALALILASSEDSEDSQYDSEIEEMFKQQLDEVLDRWVTPSMCIFVCGFLCLQWTIQYSYIVYIIYINEKMTEMI